MRSATASDDRTASKEPFIHEQNLLRSGGVNLDRCSVRRKSICLVGFALLGFGGCSSHRSSATGATTGAATSAARTSTVVSQPTSQPLVAVPAGARPQPSASKAVDALLAAEVAEDHEASFALLSSAGRAQFPSAADWSRHRTELAPVTAYRIESVDGAEVRVLVDHKAAIDPFVGLQFAKEHEVWHTREEGSGWLVDALAEVEPIVPADAGAASVALQWARARQRCDDAHATALQAVAPPLGVSAGAAALCHAVGTLAAGTPSAASPGPETAVLVAQYGSDVLRFVRRVEITGVPKLVRVFLVPMGDAWRVLAVGD